VADLDTSGVVHVQDLDRDFTGPGFSNEKAAFVSKMTSPELAARMKEGNNFSVEQSRQIRSLGRIAFPAREAQVLCVVAASVLARNNVFDVEGEEIKIVLVDPAVFATSFGTLPNQRPCLCVDHHALEESARSCRALDLRSATKVPNET
jgi:hypothetical protein